jgi:hypothetical protein
MRCGGVWEIEPSLTHCLLANTIEKFSHRFTYETVLALRSGAVPRARHQLERVFVRWSSQLGRKFAVFVGKLSVLRDKFHGCPSGAIKKVDCNVSM